MFGQEDDRPDWMRDEDFWKWAQAAYAGDLAILQHAGVMLEGHDFSQTHEGSAVHNVMERFRRRYQGWQGALEAIQYRGVKSMDPGNKMKP